MYVLQTDTKMPLVSIITASNGGNVVVGTKLSRGQTAKEEDARSALCGWLDKLKTGPEGEAIAEAVRVSSGSTSRSRPLRSGCPPNGQGRQAAAAGINTAPLRALFSGTSTPPDTDAMYQPLLVKYSAVVHHRWPGLHRPAQPLAKTFEVGYLVTKMKGIGGIGGRQSNDDNNANFTVHCALAPDQMALGATLRENDWVKLEGVVDKMDTGGVHLRDCRQVK